MNFTKKQQILRFKILNKIYVKGPISRIDISKETGITPATVSEITNILISEKLIYEIGEVTSKENTVGRKKILLGISPNHSFYIGSELSQKYISFCLTDNLGNIFNKKTLYLDFKTLNFSLTEEFYIYELKEFINSCKHYSPKGIGIALPGHFHANNASIITNNSFWKDFNIKTLTNSIDLPIYLENNVNCMAIAERLFNSNKSDDNFIFFHISRGMFCSYIYNDTLYTKNNFPVGEIGHIIVHPDGELCECGKRGCLQTYASESWILKKSRILFDNSQTTYLKQLVDNKNKITIETVLKAYKLGDEGIISILHLAIKYLSITLSNLSLIIDSNKIIVHGELFNEPLLITLLKEYLTPNVRLLKNYLSPNIIFKNYNIYNGAVAASAFCISKNLIELDR